jgi:hypothetical protein
LRAPCTRALRRALWRSSLWVSLSVVVAPFEGALVPVHPSARPLPRQQASVACVGAVADSGLVRAARCEGSNSPCSNSRVCLAAARQGTAVPRLGCLHFPCLGLRSTSGDRVPCTSKSKKGRTRYQTAALAARESGRGDTPTAPQRPPMLRVHWRASTLERWLLRPLTSVRVWPRPQEKSTVGVRMRSKRPMSRRRGRSHTDGVAVAACHKCTSGRCDRRPARTMSSHFNDRTLYTQTRLGPAAVVTGRRAHRASRQAPGAFVHQTFSVPFCYWPDALSLGKLSPCIPPY